MPIKFDLKKVKEDNNCINYFETGLYDPENGTRSIKQALDLDFDKLYCIEILDKWVESGKKVYKSDIEKNRLTIIKDDSTYLKKYLDMYDFSNKTIFFLDAHVDDNNIKNYVKKCPLIEELTAIKSLQRKDNVILIDDLRIVTTDVWNENSYGNINMLEECKKIILSINSNYKFEKLNGHTKDDVLYCYV